MNISKHKNLWIIASFNLDRYKAKSISIIVPLIMIMAVASFMMFTRGGFIKDAEMARAFLPDITVQGLEAGRISKISLDLKEEIKKIPHVKTVVPRVWGYIPLQTEVGDVAFTLMGLDIANMIKDDNFPWTVESGSFFVPEDRGKTILGDGVAQSLDANVGDIIQLEDTLGNKGEFKIIGILKNIVQVYSTDMIIVPMQDARDFFSIGNNFASDLLVYTDKAENADLVAMMIANSYKNTRVITAKALTNLIKEAFGRRSGTFQAMWLMLLVTVLLLLWAQSSHISIDVSKEIGILKAIGWHTGDIIETKIMESLILAILGTAIGILIGFIYALMGTPGISGYCIGCVSIYPKFPVPVHCDLNSIFLLFVLGVVPFIGISAFPAWLAGSIDPDEAIRG